MVEGVTGVEHSTCVLDDTSSLRRINGAPGQVIHLGDGAASLFVVAQEYTL